MSEPTHTLGGPPPSDDEDMTLSERVICSVDMILRARDIKQAELARRAGMSEETLSRRLRDKPELLRLGEAVAIAAALECGLDYLADPERVYLDEFTLVRKTFRAIDGEAGHRNFRGIGGPDLKILRDLE